LATARRLLAGTPLLQVNIADKQVNVAERQINVAR